MTPLVLGGDHSIAAGTVSGVAEFYRRAEPEDRPDLDRRALRHQHAGDLTQRQRARHAAGRAAGAGAGAAGEYLRLVAEGAPENTVLIGVRDIDATEKENIRRAGITEVYTMRDIDERGMRTVMEEALRAAGRGTAGYHVSLDMDWIDPEDAPGVGTPVRGGATYREAHLAMEIIADHGRHGQLRDRRSESGDRRAQPHRRPGGRADLLRVREEDSVAEAVPYCQPADSDGLVACTGSQPGNARPLDQDPVDAELLAAGAGNPLSENASSRRQPRVCCSQSGARLGTCVATAASLTASASSLRSARARKL